MVEMPTELCIKGQAGLWWMETNRERIESKGKNLEKRSRDAFAEQSCISVLCMHKDAF